MSTTISPQALVSQLQWRYATKKFDPARVLSAETWEGIEKALVLTPSSFGLQPWKFIVISNPKVRRDLVPASWNQTQPVDCSHFVVFAHRLNLGESDINQFIELNAGIRKVPVESLEGYRKMMVGNLVNGPGRAVINEWAIRQAYIALGNLMTAAAVLGVDTCPMEGFEPEKYDQILGLKGTGFASCVACAVGYRAVDDKYASLAKVRYSSKDVVLHIR